MVSGKVAATNVTTWLEKLNFAKKKLKSKLNGVMDKHKINK